MVRPVPIAPLPPPVLGMASSERRGRGPERRTTVVPAPIITLALRLLFLSRWSRRTGIPVVIAKAAATKQTRLRACGARRAGLEEGKSWMPDEDSNLD